MASLAPVATQSSVLVVDDNAANRTLARLTLEGEGYRVVLAESGPECIAAFERDRPGCILMDVRMPGMDGFVTCEHIRTLPHGAETPILFLTALRDVDTFDKAQRAGGDDFLSKPISPIEMIIRVQAALKLGELRVELRGHYALLKRQRDDLLRLQLQKERLTAFLVHDLKNPVHVIALHSQVMLRTPALPETARTSVTRIHTAAHQLNRMIMNLLDLSKAEEGRLTPQRARVDLKAMGSALLDEFEVVAQARQVELRVSLEVEQLEADAELLRRTLANLLENAIRHSPRGSVVQLSTARRGVADEVRVADAGPGIPEGLREKIFAPFFQAGAGEGDGRGLGLAFCRLAVEAHGGRIWVEDGAPGSVFCLSVPHVA
jgi:signal transduction histidine kinase